jgi:pyridoxamine 5'-phosphate oxidase
MPLEPSDLDADPVAQLGQWLADAERAGVPLPNAFALGTADADGQPAVRFVLLRGLDAEGLRWYTNRASRKGRDVAVNPWASAAFWWPALDRQVRVTGPVRQLPDDASDAYWRTRPRGSQLSASASEQGREIGSRAELEARVAALAERYPDDVPLPPTWGGYLLIPRADRLHDRVEYRRGADGTWHRRRLQP